ncbi:hypothetical protein L573_3077 [Bordetella holmesii H620]|nr:hypothetical protein L573_3077 [Bordetella holmesii H620]
MQPGHQGEQRLGDDGQPAVVDHQFEAGSDGRHRLLILRADPQLGFGRCAGARRHLAEGFDGARGEQIGLDLQQLVGPGLALLRHPGRGEVVLNDTDPAVVRLLDVAGLVLGNITEGDLLELVLLGVHRHAGEGVIETRGAGGVVAVALELHVDRGALRRVADVGHVVAHVDVVAAAIQRVGLAYAQAAGLRFEADHQLVAGEFAIGRGDGKGRQVRGEALPRANQPGLCCIRQIGGTIQQHHGLIVVGAGGILEQFGSHQLGARRAEGQAKDVGRDDHFLGLSRHDGHAAGHRARSGRRRWRTGHRGRGGVIDHRGRGIGGRLLFGAGRGGAKKRRLTVMDLPVVPEEQQREGKNHPEDSSSNIHGA